MRRRKVCPECRRAGEDVYQVVPACDFNPRGLADGFLIPHGNIIDGTTTCEEDYCHPRDIPLDVFRESEGARAIPQEVFTYCRACNMQIG